ncbi:MAG: sialidase family protein [Armatimonadota bacterium]
MPTQSKGSHAVIEHGVVCAMPGDLYGYFGWPTVARMEDGTLVVVASGMRVQHVCPYGRTVLLKSVDEGGTWTSPRVINDSPFDDRDAGILALGGERLLLTWFTSDTRQYTPHHSEWTEGLRWMSDENTAKFVGAWTRMSDDGGDSWNPPMRLPVNTPHGPILLRNGEILFFGKQFRNPERDPAEFEGQIQTLTSRDGISWTALGCVPIYPGTNLDNYHEPHVVELPSGKLIGHIRLENRVEHDVTAVGLTHFTLMQTESTDGGRTWTTAQPLGILGGPPHLLRHSSGALVCVYGYRHREHPFGECAAVSYDEGKTWQHDLILRDDGPSVDLGYPSSVELADGSIFTVYYQQLNEGEKTSLLWTRWRLPE